MQFQTFKNKETVNLMINRLKLAEQFYLNKIKQLGNNNKKMKFNKIMNHLKV